MAELICGNCNGPAREGVLRDAETARELQVYYCPDCGAVHPLEGNVDFVGLAEPPAGFAFDSHWDDHPDHPVETWRGEVANGDTRQGYQEWCRTNEMLKEAGEHPYGEPE